MNGPNVKPFEAQLTLDLKLYKEFTSSYALYNPLTWIASFLAVGTGFYMFWLFMIASREPGQFSLWILAFMGVFWGTQLFIRLRQKDGGKSFRQLLATNNGCPIHIDYSFLADGIHCADPFTGVSHKVDFSRIRHVYTTENLIVLMIDHRQCLLIQRNTLSGGPEGFFLETLLSKCPRIRRKRLTSLIPGRFCKTALGVFSVLGLLLGLWWSTPVQNLVYAQRQINDSMSYTQIAGELAQLGITGIDPSLAEELDREFGAFEYDISYYSGSSKALTLLTMAGMGSYDPDTWEWTPSQAGVYWFDAEVMGVDTMYTDFLLGVSKLDSQALQFTQIEEDLSQVDLMAGTGTQTVRFTYRQERCSISCRVDYDWFDLSFPRQLNAVLQKHSGGKQLYFAWDGGQGYLVFYCNSQWAKEFTRATGIVLSADPETLDTMY